MKDKLQITFFGTPEFAVPTLKALHSANFCEVKIVVTQPDKPIGRHHSKLVPSDVKKVAKELGIEVMVDSGQLVVDSSINLGVLVAYGDIIPKKIIDSFPMGILNIHPSLLPKYRGSSPIQNAILNQDKETGITIMKLDNKMDHGPIVAQETIKLDKTETAGELHDKLAINGADLLIKILPDYIQGKIEPKEQDHDKATFTEKLTKQTAKINNPGDGPLELEAFVRAMNPWPGAWTTWHPPSLKLRRVKSKKLIIWSIDKHGNPTEVQLEGKKRMPYGAFTKGHSDFCVEQLMTPTQDFES